MGEPSCSRCRGAQRSFPGHIEIQMMSLSFNCKKKHQRDAMLKLGFSICSDRKSNRRSLHIKECGL